MPIVDLTTPTTKISAATQDKDGLMSSADKTKLDGISTATAQQEGLVKPDGETIKIEDGVITAIGAVASMKWIELE
ncbi:MAG: hypothetical protein IJG38_02290 [Thermoguttaceae bacterium]|nr:hypothetical protein [Thermoguttaceae bacterium]